MNFNQIPYNPATDEGTGMLVPLVKGLNHLVFAAERLHSARTNIDELIEREVATAQTHWLVIKKPNLSVQANEYIDSIGNLLNSYYSGLVTFSTEEKKENLTKLINRIYQVLASLDRELAGLRDSDPGRKI